MDQIFLLYTFLESEIIMKKLLIYTAIILNSIPLLFTLLFLLLGTTDSFNEQAEKTKLFFGYEKLDFSILCIFFILLPIINIYFLIKAKQIL